MTPIFDRGWVVHGAAHGVEERAVTTTITIDEECPELQQKLSKYGLPTHTRRHDLFGIMPTKQTSR